MMFEKPAEVLDYVGTLRSERGQWEAVWQEISDHLVGTGQFTAERTQGEKRHRFIFDATAMQSALFLAGSIQTHLVSPSAQWVSLTAEDEELLEKPDVQRWLVSQGKKLQRMFQDPRRSFVTASAEFMQSLVYYGTGCLYVPDVDGLGLYFLHRPLNEIFIEENHLGRIDVVARCFKLTVRKFLLTFGQGASERVDKLYQKGKFNEKVECHHLVYPLEEPKDGKPIRSVYVVDGEREFVRESGFFTMPYIVARWAKESHETYGRSPSWTALSEGNTLNEITKYVIKGVQKQVDPPMLVPDDGVLGVVKTTPGGMNVYRAGLFREDMIRPIPGPDPIQVNSTIDFISKRQAMVKSAFFSSMLQIPDDPRASATQVIELATQSMKLMAPMMGRLEVEGIDPLVTRAFDVAWRNGEFEPPPNELQGRAIRTVFHSPVIRAQLASEARSILEVWQSAGQIGSVEPSAIDMLDPDESMKAIHKASGAPPEILRTDEAIQTVREARQQVAEQQMALQAVEKIGKLAPKMANGGIPQ